MPHPFTDYTRAPKRVVVHDGDIDRALKLLRPTFDQARAACKRREAFRSPGEQRRRDLNRAIKERRRREKLAAQRGF